LFEKNKEKKAILFTRIKRAIGKVVINSFKPTSSTLNDTITKTQNVFWNNDFEETPEMAFDSSTPEKEFESYLNFPIQSKQEYTNIYSFWEAKKELFPRLYQISQKVLCIIPSTASSERVWSMLGRIITKYRSKMSPSTVELLVSLKGSIEYWI